MNIGQAKEEFIKIFKEKIKREGADKLLDYLIKSDFFNAPASSKFHSNFEGGLCLHSLNAYKRYLNILEAEYGANYFSQISEESIAIIALLHDVCKISYYKQDYRNVKENGIWIQKPYFSVDEALPYGHGEKSVYILSGFIKLTREEAMAINWHMGGFDERCKGNNYALPKAWKMYPNAFIFHLADMQATYLDEVIEE